MDSHELAVVEAPEEAVADESADQALALNIEGLRFWLKEVILENAKLEKEVQLSKEARSLAAEIVHRGTPHVIEASQSQLPRGAHAVDRKKKKPRRKKPVPETPLPVREGNQLADLPNGNGNAIAADQPIAPPTTQGEQQGASSISATGHLLETSTHAPKSHSVQDTAQEGQELSNKRAAEDTGAETDSSKKQKVAKEPVSPAEDYIPVLQQ